MEKPIKKMIWSIVFIITGSYLGLCVLLFLFQGKLLYFPTDDVFTTPARAGMEYEEVFFQTVEGKKLWAWHIKAKQPKGVLLFCHGNAGNLTHRMESISVFYKMSLDVFIFDYEGYGKSEGSPSEKATYRDVEAAWRYLVEQKGVPPERIVVFGRSLGGPIAAWIASQKRPKALILESTFTSLPDLASQFYPWFPVKLLSRFRYKTKEHLSRVECPVLILHSRNDEIVPFEHGERLFQAARGHKEFLEIQGGHNDGFLVSSPLYETKIQEFLQQCEKK